MKLDNADALKTWLIKSLAPICDADTNKLATYIIALLKKDLPETNLRTLCNDQLQVFLEDKTQTFVDSVFIEITQNKSHLSLNTKTSEVLPCTNTTSTSEALTTLKKHSPPVRRRRRTSRHKHRRHGSYSGSSTDQSSRSRSSSKSTSNSRSRSRSRTRVHTPTHDEPIAYRGGGVGGSVGKLAFDGNDQKVSQPQMPHMYHQQMNYNNNKRDGQKQRNLPLAQNYYQQRQQMMLPRAQNRPRSLISITPHDNDHQVKVENDSVGETGKGIKRHLNTSRPQIDSPKTQEKSSSDNPKHSTLIIRKIPKDLNTEMKLREHFEQFGQLVQIQVNFDGLQDAALVQFHNQKEAQAAIKCPQPVFNNRFIRLFWFNTYKRQEVNQHQQPPKEPSTPTLDEPAFKKPVKERLGTFATHETTNTPLQMSPHVNKENNVNLNPATLKLVTHNNQTQIQSESTSILTEQQAPPAPPGKLKFVKKQQTVEDASLKTVQLKKELRDKTQKLIGEQINQAKILFQKIALCKTDDEKAEILSTIKQVNSMIEKQKNALLKCDAELSKMKNPIGVSLTMPKDDCLIKHKPKPQAYIPQKTQVSVDHRPKKLIVTQIRSSDEKLGIVKHMRLFGAIETFEATNEDELIFDFLSRKDAEIALSKGSTFKSKPLLINWYKEELIGKRNVDQYISSNDNNQLQNAPNEDKELEDVKHDDDSLVTKLLADDNDEVDYDDENYVLAETMPTTSRSWRI